jgi:hypothetical protein
MAVKQRLLAHSVAGEQQTPLAGVPNGDGEHAPELREAVLVGVLVEMSNYFGIGMSGKGVATLQEQLAKFRIVVNFSIQQDPNGSVLVGKRLVPASYVNDAQPAVAKTDVGGHIDPGVVRTAVSQRVIHALDQVAGDRVRAANINDAANAAHFCSLLPTAPRNPTRQAEASLPAGVGLPAAISGSFLAGTPEPTRATGPRAQWRCLAGNPAKWTPLGRGQARSPSQSIPLLPAPAGPAAALLLETT